MSEETKAATPPEVAEAEEALARGDHARVRTLTDTMSKSSDEVVRVAAQRIRRAIEVDPAQVATIVACLLLFLGIAYTYLF